jgi:hypothetical protein
MPVSRKQEERALSSDERAIVAKSRPPALHGLSDGELAKLVKLTRDRRDRAKTMAARKRREMRGKAGGLRGARGAAPARADEGSALKLSVLSMAARRFADETDRRRRVTARTQLVASAKKALAGKRKAERAAPAFKTRSANPGLRPKESKRVESLIRPAERGRLRKAQAVAQAKKDARGREG